VFVSNREALSTLDKAHSILQEALAIQGELAIAEPNRYRPEFVDSLNNLGLVLLELRRNREALLALQQANTLWQDLYDLDPGRFQPCLARGMNNLGDALEACGSRDQALTVRREALDLWRTCANRDLELWRPHYLHLARQLGLAPTDLQP
jgi:tetratricopeptide (TPR) repeat protein